jgi:hypothetical protein
LGASNCPICTPKAPIAVPARGQASRTTDFALAFDLAAELKASRIHEYRVHDMPKRKTDKLARAKARPDPAQWGEDEVMTLIEAAVVFFPHGPLTLSSLRRAATAGTLEIAKVAGKDLTTPRAIRKLVKPSCRAEKPSRRDSGSEKTKDAGSSSIMQVESDGKSAQAAAAMTLTAHRKIHRLAPQAHNWGDRSSYPLNS